MLDLSTSSTYQGILAEGKAQGKAEGEARGKAEGERQLLIVFGSKRLGDPDEATRNSLGQINSSERLESLAARLLEVESWAELLTE